VEAATRLAKEIFVELGMIIDYAVHLYGARIKPGDENFEEHMDHWKEKAIPFLKVAEAIANNEAHVMVDRDVRNKIVGFRLRQPHIRFSVPTRSILLAGFGQKPELWWRRGRIK
jgi:hypothetical protein